MICLQFAWFEVRSCNIQDLDYLLHILLQLHGKVEIFIKYSIYSQRKPPDFMKKPGVHFFSLPSVCTSLSVLYSVMTSFVSLAAALWDVPKPSAFRGARSQPFFTLRILTLLRNASSSAQVRFDFPPLFGNMSPRSSSRTHFFSGRREDRTREIGGNRAYA